MWLAEWRIRKWCTPSTKIDEGNIKNKQINYHWLSSLDSFRYISKALYNNTYMNNVASNLIFFSITVLDVMRFW